MKLARTEPTESERDASICLVIPYYEAGENLTASLMSVRLTPRDMILVVDDGSKTTPATAFCPKSVHGVPVTLLTLQKNVGIAGALRAGIAVVPPQFPLIARLDCGDISAPNRFGLQRQFLSEHPQHGIVGSWATFVSPSGEKLYTERFPTSSTDIRKRMRVNSAFCHPAVLFRRAIYDQSSGYSDDYPAAEDYALFREMLKLSDGANIDRPLVTCLTSDGGISERQRKRQLATRIKVIYQNFDFHPMSAYGIIRGILQLATSRRFTTFAKRVLQREDRSLQDSQ